MNILIKIKKMSKELPYKVLILGDSTVGKTCFLIRYVDDSYDDSTLATMGMDYRLKNVKMEDGTKVKLHIWDTVGQERYRSISKNFYKGAHAIILIFSIVDKKSFGSVENWINKIKEEASESVSIILVGNKCDLKEERLIPYEEAEKLAKEFNINYFECSAKTGENINVAFNDLIEQMVEKTDRTKDSTTQLNSENLGNKKKTCCNKS